VRLGRAHPVIVGSGVFLTLGTDIGEVFDPRYVGGVGPMQIATGIVILAQRNEVAATAHLIDQTLVFGLGSVTPMDIFGLRQLGNLIYPVL
jgi:hypothetical protein